MIIEAILAAVAVANALAAMTPSKPNPPEEESTFDDSEFKRDPSYDMDGCSSPTQDRQTTLDEWGA